MNEPHKLDGRHILSLRHAPLQPIPRHLKRVFCQTRVIEGIVQTLKHDEEWNSPPSNDQLARKKGVLHDINVDYDARHEPTLKTLCGHRRL